MYFLKTGDVYNMVCCQGKQFLRVCEDYNHQLHHLFACNTTGEGATISTQTQRHKRLAILTGNSNSLLWKPSQAEEEPPTTIIQGMGRDLLLNSTHLQLSPTFTWRTKSNWRGFSRMVIYKVRIRCMWQVVNVCQTTKGRFSMLLHFHKACHPSEHHSQHRLE